MTKDMKKVVTIGGGTGSYMMLSGLKHFSLDITAVYSTFDNGGDTGKLRDEFGMLPPGDVRRCLVALAPEENQEIIRRLFNFRFDKDSSLKGHNFGNIFLTGFSASIIDAAKGGVALTREQVEVQAIKEASQILNIKGTVLPVSLGNAHLHALLEDGSEVVGETNIDIPKHDGSLKIKKVFLQPAAQIYEETAKAILEADSIVIGPGDLYTSLIPNLLVSGMKEALAQSSAKKIAVCNVMTKWGETNGFKASDMIRELLEYSGLPKFDHVFCAGSDIAPDVLARYEKEKQYPMLVDEENLAQLADRVVRVAKFAESDVVRYDPQTIASMIAEL